MTEVPVPELPELTRIHSWPKFSPRISDNGTNLSLSIPATSSSFQGNGFFDYESSKGGADDSTALTAANTTEQSDSADNEPIAAANINSSLVSTTSPFDASISLIAEAKDDVPDISDEKLVKDLTLHLENDDNAGEEEQPGIPQMQESDDLSSLSASNDGIEMAMSDDSDDSITYLMRYCRCIESLKSDEDDGEDDRIAKGMEGEIRIMNTDDNDSSATDGESFTPELSMYGGKANNKTCKGGGRAASSKQKRPHQPAFTSMDVLDIMTTPQESEETRTKKKKNDDKKSGAFTSFDVLGVLFGSCIGCGWGCANRKPDPKFSWKEFLYGGVYKIIRK